MVSATSGGKIILSLHQRLFGSCRESKCHCLLANRYAARHARGVSRLSFRLRGLMLGCEPREGNNDTNAREAPMQQLEFEHLAAPWRKGLETHLASGCTKSAQRAFPNRAKSKSQAL